jgi:hypothetical protein
MVGDFVREFVCLDSTKRGNVSRPGEFEKGDGEDFAFSVDEDTRRSDPNAEVKLSKPMPHNCVQMRVIAARKMSMQPFSSFKFDGVIGLGLPALAIHPEFHFFNMLTQQHNRTVAPIFSFYLAREHHDGDMLTVGGYEDSRMMGPLSWVPVMNPDDGHWRVGIDSVDIGGKALEFCSTGNCSAIVDTGTSLLGVPQEVMKTMFKSTVRVVPGASSVENVNCREESGPPITFHMTGGVDIVVDASAYSRPGAATLKRPSGDVVVCEGKFLSQRSTDFPTFLFGEPVLQKYYTSFDTQGKRVGFTLARHDLKTGTLPSAGDAELAI